MSLLILIESSVSPKHPPHKSTHPISPERLSALSRSSFFLYHLWFPGAAAVSSSSSFRAHDGKHRTGIWMWYVHCKRMGLHLMDGWTTAGQVVSKCDGLPRSEVSPLWTRTFDGKNSRFRVIHSGQVCTAKILLFLRAVTISHQRIVETMDEHFLLGFYLCFFDSSS